MSKIYYIANDEYMDRIYGNQDPKCIDLAEIKRLAKEWELTANELLNQMHEASQKEIETWGTYNG